MNREITITTPTGVVTLNSADKVDLTRLRLSEQTATLGELITRYNETAPAPNSAKEFGAAIERLKDNLAWMILLMGIDEEWTTSLEGAAEQYALLAIHSLEQAMRYLELAGIEEKGHD